MFAILANTIRTGICIHSIPSEFCPRKRTGANIFHPSKKEQTANSNPKTANISKLYNIL